MTGHITISIWFFLFLIAFAVWAILDRVLILFVLVLVLEIRIL